MTAWTAIGQVSAGLVLGLVVPFVFIRMLAPVLRETSQALTTNYRGRRVFLGLGVVWLIWAGCAIAGSVVLAALGGQLAGGMVLLGGLLALVAFALGVVDDAYGSSADRGFKGHLRAMARGRLTTGGLKLVGIGTACLVVAAMVSQVAPWGGSMKWATVPDAIVWAVKVLLAGAGIALTSNFVNLTDLRPGRALKVYSVLAVAGVVSTAAMLGAGGRTGPLGSIPPPARVLDAVVLLLFAYGPVIAVWRYDLGEQGMLGDAGANPMGAFAGLLMVAGLPLTGLLVYVMLVFALNLASERVSFSSVIEGNPVLSFIDRMGRSARAVEGEGRQVADGPAGPE